MSTDEGQHTGKMSVAGCLWRALKPVAGVLMAAGVAGIIATFLTGRQGILSWSAVSVGLGLALGFFREAFRPKRGNRARTALDDIAVPGSKPRAEEASRFLNAALVPLVTAFLVTILIGILVHPLFGKTLNPGLLLLYGFFSLVVINIVMFCTNLFKATGAMRKAKSEAEIEHVMVPALQGEPSQLGLSILARFRLLAAASAGFTLGAATLLLMKFLNLGI